MLPIIGFHNRGDTFKNQANLAGWYARANWQCLQFKKTLQ